MAHFRYTGQILKIDLSDGGIIKMTKETSIAFKRGDNKDGYSEDRS